MMESKPWYVSKTVWGAVVAIAASALNLGGYELGVFEQGQLVDALVAVAGSMGGIVAIYGRVVASHSIVSKQKNETS